MVGKADTWEAGLLRLVFENQDFTLLGDAGGIRGSAVAGSIFISLHTADPGETGTQATSEATYTPYARQGVARSTAGWTIAGTAPTVADNDAAITFAEATSGSDTITHFGIGTDSSGAGKLMYSGALTTSLAVSVGITPQFNAGDCNIEEA